MKRLTELRLQNFSTSTLRRRHLLHLNLSFAIGILLPNLAASSRGSTSARWKQSLHVTPSGNPL
jgi:hypothetical protein